MAYLGSMARHQVPDQSPATEAAHSVQLFDELDSLARTVAAFLAAGWHAGDTLLVVATAEHWSAIAARLLAIGLPLPAAIASGRLTLRDAGRTLDLFRQHEQLDPARFEATVGRLVDSLAARGPRLRIFGEMVDLLAGSGAFRCAEQLEALWNELASRQPFALMCGYTATAFGDPRSQEALRRICDAHERIHTDPDDLLASFLVDRVRRPSSTAIAPT
jgi:hypothetical protein